MDSRKQKFLDIFEDPKINPFNWEVINPLVVADNLDAMGFFTAPASTKYHGNYPGGLFDHSLAFYEELMKLTEGMNLVWLRPASPAIIAFFHDLCKVDKYIQVPDTSKPKTIGNTPMMYEYNKTPSPWGDGHAVKSVAIAATFCKLTEEEVLCIRHHMGAYEKDEWENYDAAIRKYPNVLFSHTADMMASKIRNT